MGQYKEIVIAQPKSTNPIEQQKSQVYRGVSSINENSKSFALYDIELIKQDLINHFNIRKGEKIYDANFGSILHDAIHEPMTTDVREQIVANVQEIIDSDPRVTATNIDIVEREYGIQLAIELEFVDYSQVETIVYNFDKASGL